MVTGVTTVIIGKEGIVRDITRTIAGFEEIVGPNLMVSSFLYNF